MDRIDRLTAFAAIVFGVVGLVIDSLELITYALLVVVVILLWAVNDHLKAIRGLLQKEDRDGESEDEH